MADSNLEAPLLTYYFPSILQKFLTKENQQMDLERE